MESELSADSLLPHLHALDVHTGIVAFTPGWQPLFLGAPEIASSGLSYVHPRLGANAVSVFEVRQLFSSWKDDEG